MGIKGLFPLITPLLKKRHISTFKNQKIGIDGHAWLHSILPSIALQLYKDEKTTLHHKIFLKRIDKLKKHQIIPIVVFDGDSLPSKECIDEKRRLKREESKRMAEVEMKRGNVREAVRHMSSSISISSSILHSVTRFLRKNGVEVIISPYESDAQLSYLQRTNYIHAILTEDSDLMIYNCTNILYKYSDDYIYHYDKSILQKKNNFLYENLLNVAILSGCDYLENIKGVGINTAIKLLRTHNSIELVVNEIRKKKNVPESYLSDFMNAKLTFKYQVVYDPERCDRVYLDGTVKEKSYKFLGNIDEQKRIKKMEVIGNEIEMESIEEKVDGTRKREMENAEEKEDGTRKCEMENIEEKEDLKSDAPSPLVNQRELSGISLKKKIDLEEVVLVNKKHKKNVKNIKAVSKKLYSKNFRKQMLQNLSKKE